MKKIILAAVLSMASTMAFASATMDTNTNSNSQGSNEGVGASALTGNGDVVGGNGTTSGSDSDQTTGAGTRVDSLIAAHDQHGYESGHASGLANGNNGTTQNSGGNK